MKKLTAEQIAAEMDAFEKLYPIPRYTSRCGNGYAVSEFNAWDGHEYCNMWKGWIARAEIALPALEQKTHESIIAEQLECVRDSLTLNLHQEAIINCAIDRLNELNKRIQDLSRSQLEPQPTTDTYRQIENDGREE